MEIFGSGVTCASIEFDGTLQVNLDPATVFVVPRQGIAGCRVAGVAAAIRGGYRTARPPMMRGSVITEARRYGLGS